MVVAPHDAVDEDDASDSEDAVGEDDAVDEDAEVGPTPHGAAAAADLEEKRERVNSQTLYGNLLHIKLIWAGKQFKCDKHSVVRDMPIFGTIHMGVVYDLPFWEQHKLVLFMTCPFLGHKKTSTIS